MSRFVPFVLLAAALSGCATYDPLPYNEPPAAVYAPAVPPPRPEPEPPTAPEPEPRAPPVVTYPHRLQAPPAGVTTALKERNVAIFDYHPSVTYTVHAKPLRVTVIQLEPGEILLNAVAGDGERWLVEEGTLGSAHNPIAVITVKPVHSFTGTNLVLTTDRRLYHLNLVSRREGEGEPFNAEVRWDYAREQGMQITAAPG